LAFWESQAKLLEKTYFDNTVLEYLLATASFIALWVFLIAIKRFLHRNLGKKAIALGLPERVALILRIFTSIYPVVPALVALYLTTKRLDLAPFFEKTLWHVVLSVLVFQGIVIAAHLADFFIGQLSFGKADDDLSLRNTRANLLAILKAGIWVCGALFLLSNLGVDITTFITGLGIGGIAIALAAQSVLGDVFSSFTIAIDKPFEVGDFIIVDSLQGTVENVGLKTTRIRSLGGELLVIANSDLTKSKIQNFKRMNTRRINFKIGVDYETPQAKLRGVGKIIQEAIESTAHTRFERAHLMEFGNSSLNFDVVYHLQSPDYQVYCDVQQEINIKILEAFNRQQISIPFPTQTLIVSSIPGLSLRPQET